VTRQGRKQGSEASDTDTEAAGAELRLRPGRDGGVRAADGARGAERLRQVDVAAGVDNEDIFRSIIPLFNMLRTAPIYALRPEHLRRTTRMSETAHLGEGRWVSLYPDGRALSHAVAHLLLRGREIVERIERALAAAMPQVKRIGVREQNQVGDKTEFGYQLELVITFALPALAPALRRCRLGRG
jgi:hypothetical protein